MKKEIKFMVCQKKVLKLNEINSKLLLKINVVHYGRNGLEGEGANDKG